MTDFCQVCFTPYDWRGIHNHHLVHRSRRRCDESFNLIRLCGRDHAAVHGECEPSFPPLTFPMLLGVKRSSGDDWRPHDLGALYRPKTLWLPAIEELPERYLEERRRFTLESPMKPTHSTAAEEAMRDPFFMPGWTLTKVIDEQNRVEWQVIDGPRMQAGVNVLSRGDTDVAAIVAAVEENRRKRA